MKRLLLFTLLASTLGTSAFSQEDKSKRPSPPDSVTQTTTSGVTVTINYSKPSVNGRTFGKEIAPYGKVWRTGANEATTFEINKNATIEGQPLPAGKYSIHSIPTEGEWTIIFNKVWQQWGSFQYKDTEDALRVKVKPTKAPAFAEKFIIKVNPSGVVTLAWGDTQASFTVK